MGSRWDYVGEHSAKQKSHGNPHGNSRGELPWKFQSCQFLIRSNFIFRSGTLQNCRACEVFNLAFLYSAEAWLRFPPRAEFMIWLFYISRGAFFESTWFPFIPRVWFVYTWYLRVEPKLHCLAKEWRGKSSRIFNSAFLYSASALSNFAQPAKLFFGIFKFGWGAFQNCRAKKKTPQLKNWL